MSSSSPQAFNNLIPLKRKDSRIIVFIDSSIANCETIAQRVIPQARAIIIGSEDNGVKEISKILRASSCPEIHILSSGFPGCICLGNSELSINTLITYSLELETWFNTINLIERNLVNSRHLYFYSSNLGIGDAGEEFALKLSPIIKAKIFISSDLASNDILNHAA